MLKGKTDACDTRSTAKIDTSEDEIETGCCHRSGSEELKAQPFTIPQFIQ